MIVLPPIIFICSSLVKTSRGAIGGDIFCPTCYPLFGQIGPSGSQFGSDSGASHSQLHG